MTKPTTARTCIVEAFLQLCQTLPCDKITVSQLTKKAGYNRSTFYAYFNNTDDLLKQLENELFQLVDTFLPHGLRIFRTGMPTAEERLLSQRFFKSNARILAMLLGQNGDPRFVHKMKNHIRKVLIQNLQLTTQQISTAPADGSPPCMSSAATAIPRYSFASSSVPKLLYIAPGYPITCFLHSSQVRNIPIFLPCLTA